MSLKEAITITRSAQPSQEKRSDADGSAGGTQRAPPHWPRCRTSRADFPKVAQNLEYGDFLSSQLLWSREICMGTRVRIFCGDLGATGYRFCVLVVMPLRQPADPGGYLRSAIESFASHTRFCTSFFLHSQTKNPLTPLRTCVPTATSRVPNSKNSTTLVCNESPTRRKVTAKPGLLNY